MRRLALLAPFAVAALLAGCGSSSSTSSSSTAAAGSGSSSTATSTPAAASGGGSRLTLSETEFKITPASPAVAHTGAITITVKNTGAVTHALSVQTPAGVVSTGNITPGASTTLKVNATKAGHYTFFCPIDGHRASGMQGVLIVGSGSSSTSGTAPATTSTSSASSGKYGY